MQGKTLRCSISETKNRLFIGNVPKDLTEDEFKKIIEEVGPGMEVLELIKVELELNSSLISQVDMTACLANAIFLLISGSSNSNSQPWFCFYIVLQ
jgi:RNA recognition motif-containing protein